MKQSGPIFFLFIAVLACLSVTPGGCISTAKNIESPADITQRQKDRSLVFGKIQWLEDGKEKEIGKGIVSLSVEPHLIKMENKHRIFGKVDAGGHFVWSLEAGTYVIHKLAYRDPWSGNYFFVPKVAFMVPKNGENYYIGTLRCDYKPERDFLGGMSGTATFTIQDDADRETVDFQQKFNTPSADIKKTLMIHDPRLPRSIESTAEFNLALQILNTALFGISQ